MKLQIKLILYNLVIKAAIIFILTTVIVIFLDKISLSHLKQRIFDKREKLVKNLSPNEIAELLEAEKTFTDYNILKEEYIILNKTSPRELKSGQAEKFTVSEREIEGQRGDYLVLITHFRYGSDYYRLEIGETMSAVKQLKKAFLFFALLALIISAIVTLITDYAFTSFLLSPFYRIIDEKISKVNDPVNFNYETIKTTTTDFHHLDRSINNLMSKITQQFITQKQFISNVSHELLTPVSIIKTRLENMLSDGQISESAETKIIASLKTLNRLRSIVNSLLLISKVENSQYKKEDAINISTTIEEVKEDLEDRLVVKDIKLTSRIKHSFSLNGNKALIHTLFVNIVNNAIKYNRNGGTITITDEFLDDRYNVYITDNGLGMNDELIEKAFNRFEKLNTTDSESNGLGLAIVKTIADFHQINVCIKSEVDKGTEVTISFKTPDTGLPVAAV